MYCVSSLQCNVLVGDYVIPGHTDLVVALTFVILLSHTLQIAHFSTCFLES